MAWNLEVIQRLMNTDNKNSRVVDFSSYSILTGFITEFVVDQTISYNKAER